MNAPRETPRPATRSAPWPAPAKLNLFLHIVGRRPDGYHELQTCFQFVDLCDEITIEVRADGRIRRRVEIADVAEEADLCVRAARALQTAAGCPLGADIGVLLTLLYPPQAPFEANYLLLKPNINVATADVFQDPDLTRNSAPITIHGFLASGGRNDCLGVVRRRYPEVARALDWLSGFGPARLTGTGACVFLAVETIDLRQEILGELPPALEAFLARGLNDSPLLERLAIG